MRLPSPWLQLLGAVAAAIAIAAVWLVPGRRPRSSIQTIESQATAPSGLAVTPARPVEPSSRAAPLATQGQFATTLASRLGLGDDLTEDRAIGLLTSKGIVPEEGWVKGAPSTQLFLAQVQRSFHILLTEVANDLSIRVPATLNVIMFDRPQLGGQAYHVGAKDMAVLRENGGVVRLEALKAAKREQVSIETPYPSPIGDDQLPTVWSHRLRHPGASFIRVHLEKLDIAAPSYVQILDRHGLEIWQHIGGEPSNGDIWATAVAGDTATIALHAGVVASGMGLKIDSYEYGVPSTSPGK